MKTVAGLLFVVVLFTIVFGYVLQWTTPATGALIGFVAWAGLFFWRNFGSGNPVRNKINQLQQQNEWAQEDIDAMTTLRVPGYKAEVRHLNERIEKREKEISLLERTKGI